MIFIFYKLHKFIYKYYFFFNILFNIKKYVYIINKFNVVIINVWNI